VSKSGYKISSEVFGPTADSLFFAGQGSQFFNLIQVQFYNRGYLRWLPVGLFWLFGPGKRQIKYLSGLFCHFKDREGFQKHFALPLAIVHLPDRAAVRIFDGRHARDTDLSMKFRRIGQSYR
jgi:hypothetical protein